MSLLMSPGSCCGCSRRVLIWDADQDPISGAVDAWSIAPISAQVDYAINWTGQLDDYQLIIWLTAKQNPPWWNRITGNTWNGRLVITGEYYDADHNSFLNSFNFCSTLNTLTGMRVIGGFIDNGPCFSASVASNPLMAGQTNLQYDATSEVSGGVPLARTFTGSKTFLARAKPAGSKTDFVLSGDSNVFQGAICDVLNLNKAFLQNLYTVAI